jgi:protein-histidine pros-kinase
MHRLMPATLFGRLALLLLVAVLASQVLALTLIFRVLPAPHMPPPPPGHVAGTTDDRGPRPPGPEPFDGSVLTPMLWLDIGVRLGVLMLAAWVGARWLSAPIRQLAQGAQALGHNLDSPPLPESGPTECREATRVFNQMQSRLRQQIAEREQFLAAVSHDLRTPLTRIRLRAETLDNDTQQEGFRRDVAEMQSLIEATLDYLGGNSAPEAMTEVDIESLLRSLADDQSDSGHPVDVSGQAAPIRGQPRALRRCLDNLVGNAIRYGRVARLELVDSPGQLQIRVLDEGPGIPPEELEKVLAPFYRLDPSRHRGRGGAGLGLAIACDIAQRHSGTLTLSNRHPNGLLATLTLPRKVS